MSELFYVETERCCIREFQEKDLDVFMSYRNDLEWMTHQTFKGLSKEVYKMQLIQKFDINTGGQLAIINRNDAALLGDLYVVKHESEINIGYTIHPKYARQGYISEVVKELIIVLIHRYPGIKIVADATIDNLPSIKLLEKVGFKWVKTSDGNTYYEYKR